MKNKNKVTEWKQNESKTECLWEGDEGGDWGGARRGEGGVETEQYLDLPIFCHMGLQKGSRDGEVDVVSVSFHLHAFVCV